jgi:hypothetical protein
LVSLTRLSVFKGLDIFSFKSPQLMNYEILLRFYLLPSFPNPHIMGSYNMLLEDACVDLYAIPLSTKHVLISYSLYCLA